MDKATLKALGLQEDEIHFELQVRNIIPTLQGWNPDTDNLSGTE